jgi:hypothetical protein
MSLTSAEKGPLRVLDLDLDFFLYGTAHYVDSAESRLDAEEYPPWPLDDVVAFLAEQCLLTERRPGFVVEHHNEIFYRWGEALEGGRMTAPLEVVHVDAHADLGVGDASYAYVMSELAFEPIENRYGILKTRRPHSREEMLDLGSHAISDGNWLMFALACGWLSGLTYVTNSCAECSDGARPGDLMFFLMQGFDMQADHLQVVGTREDFIGRVGGPKVIEHRDPAVPFATRVRREYQAPEPFDVVCLTRSPEYTPVEADPIFDAIAERFIDETSRWFS